MARADTCRLKAGRVRARIDERVINDEGASDVLQILRQIGEELLPPQFGRGQAGRGHGTGRRERQLSLLFIHSAAVWARRFRRARL